MYSLWQDFQSLVNTFQGGWYRPQTDFERATNDISIELWDKWTSMAEKSQQIKDFLIPFLVSKNIIAKRANSYYSTIEYPKEYGRFATADIIVHEDKTVPSPTVDGGKCANGDFKTQEEITEEYFDNLKSNEIVLIDLQRWDSCLSHLTKMPTFDSPKMVQIDGKFRVAPKNVSVVVMNFYRQPKPATFKYTLSPGDPQTGLGDQIIYSPPPISTPLEWPEIAKNNFLWRLGERFGIYTKDQFMTQISTQQKTMID